MDFRSRRRPAFLRTTQVTTRSGYAYYEAPFGVLTVVGHGRQLERLWLSRLDLSADYGPQAPETLAPVFEQLTAYFAGHLEHFDLSLAPVGTAYQKRVWFALMSIPYGETRSYGWLAASLDPPSVARAVGQANGANPIAIVMPCHRVIGAKGDLVGFGGGLPIKRWLLEHESRQGTLL